MINKSGVLPRFKGEMAFETTTNWQNVEIWLQHSGFKMNMMPILCNNCIYGKILTLRDESQFINAL